MTVPLVAEDTLKALANPANQAILSLLAVEATYPRRIADLLSMAESDVSRRLRNLQDVGLVTSSWEHVEGKNVKAYDLAAEEVHVRILGKGLVVETGTAGEGEPPTVVDRLRVRVPEPEGFVGRREELAALGGPEPVVLVEGLAGIGKTSLVSAYGQRVDGDAPVFYHGFTGTESLTWLAHRLGVFLARHGQRALLDAAEEGAPLADRRELLLQALEDGDAVVLLDEVERVRDDALKDVIVEAIERDEAGKLVVAGRQLPRIDPGVDHVRHLRLEGLSRADVDQLLGDQGVGVNEATLDGIQETLGGHPMALVLFAEAASDPGVEPATLLDRLPDQEMEEYLLEEVHDHLTDAERSLLCHASVFRGPFTTGDIEAVYPRDPRGLLVELRRRRLLRREGDDYRLHALLRSFFHRRLGDPAAVHGRAADRALERGGLEARLAAMHHLLEAGDRDRVLGLLEEDLDLAEVDLVREGYHNLYLDVLEELDTDTIEDPRRAGLVDDEVGDIRHHRGEHEAALARYREAADHFRKADAPGRLADLAWKRALVHRALDQGAKAAQRVREGLAEHEPDARTRERLEEVAEEMGVDVEG